MFINISTSFPDFITAHEIRAIHSTEPVTQYHGRGRLEIIFNIFQILSLGVCAKTSDHLMGPIAVAF